MILVKNLLLLFAAGILADYSSAPNSYTQDVGDAISPYHFDMELDESYTRGFYKSIRA